MKIKKVDIPSIHSKPQGLKPIKMEKLGNIVLIAGRNGSGKTRLLKLIRETFTLIPDEYRMSLIGKSISNWKSAIETYPKRIENLLFSLEKTTDPSEKQQIQFQINSIKEQNENLRKSVSEQEPILEYSTFFEIDELLSENRVVEFVPRGNHIEDAYNLNPWELTQKATNNRTVDDVFVNTIAIIQYIQNRWTSAQLSTSNVTFNEKDRTQAISDYERLQKSIKLFLGTELAVDSELMATLFGKRIGLAGLSDGQKVLLKFCVAIYKYEGQLDRIIVMLDEPENHLHPSALIEVLDKISSNIPNGQLWIATHSIHVLAHFDSSCLWFVEDGQISYAGNIPQRVLNGLLGNDDEIERLSSFMNLPAQFASDKFSYECLFYPEVVFTKHDDPQTTQINQIIAKRIEAGKKIRVLDFGMGKGRLLASIKENNSETPVNAWLDYYGFDKYNQHQHECEELLKGVFGDGERYFIAVDKVLSELDSSSFDFIIMCNVLHEIEPGEWLNLFNSTHSLMKLLKPEGQLMIVEDQFLAVGEKAHAKGFLVLDNLQLKKLFKATEEAPIKSLDYRADGRLKAHLVPAKLTNNISAETRKEALISLKASASEAIKKVRKEEPTFKNGKLHSFWAQQLANSILALEELGE